MVHRHVSFCPSKPPSIRDLLRCTTGLGFFLFVSSRGVSLLFFPRRPHPAVPTGAGKWTAWALRNIEITVQHFHCRCEDSSADAVHRGAWRQGGKVGAAGVTVPLIRLRPAALSTTLFQDDGAPAAAAKTKGDPANDQASELPAEESVGGEEPTRRSPEASRSASGKGSKEGHDNPAAHPQSHVVPVVKLLALNQLQIYADYDSSSYLLAYQEALQLGQGWAGQVFVEKWQTDVHTGLLFPVTMHGVVSLALATDSQQRLRRVAVHRIEAKLSDVKAPVRNPSTRALAPMTATHAPRAFHRQDE